ncbi:MAG: single-stranded-DNA-specific exonuclease RecJ [Thermoleophilia bacterium]|nr:single-stranded-DNA-specific exonuclease RecJ [Thermoleophilia bacterium]
MSATPPPNIVLSPASYEDVRRVQLGLGCSETLAWVLVRRGVTDVAAARTLLEPVDVDSPAHYGDPFLLGDMSAAVERIRFAIEDEQPIVVHGDYDADGVCSTTLLVEALEALGANVRAFLPSRFEHGYGLAIETAELLARDVARLLITVDCGITAVEPIQHALDLGLDTIVLDHHQPGEVLPAAIICSTRPSNYPEPDMCATAVAGKLAQALGAPYGDSAHELEAIATIADCMPLTGENRAFVRRGLRALKRTQRPGLRALLSACDTHPTDADEETIGFRLAPRINAVGRLEHPDLAYELLRATDATAAERSALNLHAINDRRRQIEAQIVEQAHAQVARFSELERAHRIYVLSGTDWHEGVVGIVASRMVERYGRPVIVLGVSGALARGSGRSIDGVNLHAAIGDAHEFIVRGGGHAAAVGVTVDPNQLAGLRAHLAAWAEVYVTDEHMRPQMRADAVLAPDDLGVALVEEIGRLAPFGTGNERPVLFVPAAMACDAKAIGADKSHLKCRFELADGTSAPVIAFGQASLIPELAISSRVDACVTVGMNRFRESETLQLTAHSIRTVPDEAKSDGPGMCETECSIACDERLPVTELIELAAASAAGEAIDMSASEPALEPLLAHPNTVDLRHHGCGAAHVARLLTAGSSVLLVVADVSRRRELLPSHHSCRLIVCSLVHCPN